MRLEERKLAEYLMLSEGLKRLPGIDFEKYGHPAVVLDRATGPQVRVWGWWTQGGSESELPCLLWAGEMGWSATVVGPDALDTEGYERAFWSHRIKLLDLALANALGPCKTLEDLEMRVAGDSSYGLDASWSGLKGALLWGIIQLRVARAHRGRVAGGAAVRPLPAPPGMGGVMDEELAKHGLLPTVPKPRALRGSPDVRRPMGIVRSMCGAAFTPGTTGEG